MIKTCEQHDDMVIVYDARHNPICFLCDLVKKYDSMWDDVTKLHNTIAELECELEEQKRGPQ